MSDIDRLDHYRSSLNKLAFLKITWFLSTVIDVYLCDEHATIAFENFELQVQTV
jgi:hypothetical protein